MTQHFTEEQLILHYYGEGDSAHLEECQECRLRYQALQRVLNSVDVPVPERDADYEDQVWNRLAPKLHVRRRWGWLAPRKLAAVAAMAALVIAAFVTGRYLPRSGSEGSSATVAQAPVRERVLVVAVGDHLERSQMVLVELANAEPKQKIDITGEQALAEDLLGTNRLYRQTAMATGETGLASLLEDLERVLVEIVHSPGEVSAAQLEDLRERIRSQGLIFKMRVVGSGLNERFDRYRRNEATF